MFLCSFHLAVLASVQITMRCPAFCLQENVFSITLAFTLAPKLPGLATSSPVAVTVYHLPLSQLIVMLERHMCHCFKSKPSTAAVAPALDCTSRLFSAGLCAAGPDTACLHPQLPAPHELAVMRLSNSGLQAQPGQFHHPAASLQPLAYSSNHVRLALSKGGISTRLHQGQAGSCALK